MPATPALNFLQKSLRITAASIALASSMLLAQTNVAPSAPTSPATSTASSPAFDVATIKPHTGPAYSRGLRYQADGSSGTVTLPMLVQYAYSLLTEDQVVGAPDSAKNQWFDIQVKISAADIAEMQKLSPAESNARRALMMQALLADRFKLKTHSATKQVPVYELVVAKSPSKLIDAATDPKTVMGKDGKPSTGIHFMKDTAEVMAYSMSAWAGFLSQSVSGVGRPVLDKTGLTSTYNFPLNWSVYSARPTMPSAAAGDASAPDDTTSIFAALKEVGLQLRPATGPIETIVIDHSEQPTAD
jgi:bla regulator protein BlaR1